MTDAPTAAVRAIGPRACARRITILGATGSVGATSLALIEALRARHGEDACPIEALTAHRDVEKLAAIAKRVRPRYAAVADPAAGPALREALAGEPIAVGAGPQAMVEAAQRPADWVMAAIVGAAGLEPTLAAARRGADVALANKEALICAGPVFLKAIAAGGGRLLPVDSEHHAVFELLPHLNRADVTRVTLTASGGPFRTWSAEQMAAATPQEAVKHPTWSMGAKISVDSATLVNKGLELIEAHHLFGLSDDDLDVLVHPQSTVHALVEARDGSVFAHMAPPDMTLPVACALAYPERLTGAGHGLDLAAMGQLTFETPDLARFPGLGFARAALRAGGLAPAAFNAANEIAVSAFLDRGLGFLDIPTTSARVMDAFAGHDFAASDCDALETVGAVDAWARERAASVVAARA